MKKETFLTKAGFKAMLRKLQKLQTDLFLSKDIPSGWHLDISPVRLGKNRSIMLTAYKGKDENGNIICSMFNVFSFWGEERNQQEVNMVCKYLGVGPIFPENEEPKV